MYSSIPNNFNNAHKKVCKGGFDLMQIADIENKKLYMG